MKLIEVYLFLANEHHASKLFLSEESFEFQAEFQPRLEVGKTNPTQIQKTQTKWNKLIFDFTDFRTMDVKGRRDSLYLGQKGGGAIYPGNIDAQFYIKNQAN